MKDGIVPLTLEEGNISRYRPPWTGAECAGLFHIVEERGMSCREEIAIC
jgi:hypothetical protein